MIELEWFYPLMYSDYFCIVWLLRYDLVNIDPRQEIMYASGAGAGSILSLSAALGYSPLTQNLIISVKT